MTEVLIESEIPGFVEACTAAVVVSAAFAGSDCPLPPGLPADEDPDPEV